tara:strand:+ start:1613 stop:7939 length:6327 start_codon:yes stop_codon:yes gene_type:complete
MAELKRNFTSSRMNKDLDERLVPNGEYRDALNISISTSESSDTGSVESIKGNSRISTLGIAGRKCIGTARDEETNKIYWFIAGTSVDAIAEYNEDTGNVEPVLVSVKATADVLKFSSSSFITGANVLDGVLYFTDNINEPKQVDITRSKNGSTNFSTHTKLIIQSRDGNSDKGNIAEEHITIIKKSPLNAPAITMSNTLRDGTVNAQFEQSPSGTIDDEFFGTTAAGSKAPGTVLGNIVFSPKPSFEVGDNLKFTHTSTDDGEVITYEVRVVVIEIVSEAAVSKTLKTKILSITDDIIVPSSTIVWSVELEQKDPFFELVFPRFAYRWKYSNGQYSAFSPFSEIAFLPDEINGYKFDAKNGFNQAMVNTVRKITLNTFDTKPSNVVEVDILFKQSNNTNVYTVKTLKEDFTSFDITSEQIYATVPSNQLIRPYDNVPKKALAQDVVANRLVFGNYVQNYNVDDVPSFQTNILSNRITENTPTKSLKSIRKYQLGVIYLDEFGRHTPVFADDSSVVTIDQIQSNTANKIEAKITTPAPDWATHYRYYIKEPSNEYYNLALDRYYEAEDGNVWLSFSSADRNKVDNETFLILKKKHTTNSSVFKTSGGTVKYKILDISNEAPTFIKQKKTSIGKITTQFGENSTPSEGFPEVGFLSFKVKGGDINVLKDLNTTSVTDKYIRISTSQDASELYQLSSINVNDAGATGNLTEDVDTWTFNIAEPFGEDISFAGTGTNKTDGLSLEVLQEDIDENNPEFVGRFFVKVPRDSTLDSNILSGAVDRVYKVKNAQNIFKIDTTHNTHADYSNGTQLFAIDKAGGFDGDKNTLATGKGAQGGKKTIQIRLIGIGPDKEPHTLNPNVVNLTANALLDGQLRTPGTKLRWRDDPSQEVYEIVSASPIKVFNFGKGRIQRKRADNKGIRYTITLDRELSFNPQNAVQTGVTSDSGTSTVLEVVSEVINENTFASDSPAVFETEPKQAVDLELYYETSKSYPIADLATFKTLDYFNSFSFGNGVESNRIRDDFNAPTIDKGVRVSTVLAEQYKEEHKKSGLIYSGIYNSTSGINRLNQFIAGEKITKDLNPEYGSIQKLHTRNTDLIALCEDKVLKILANKDALFNADGNVNLTSTNNVLGTAMPFSGEYGIGKNPESFASFGYRAYFTDKARGAVLRLSMDGITKISNYGMGNYFKDNLAAATTVLGTYDEDSNNYNITLNNDTVSFAESINGWESRKSYIPEHGISLNKVYYTFSDGDMWKHTDTATRNTFYGSSFVDSQITLLLNDLPSSVKKYKTINYEGSRSREYNASGAQTKTGWYLNNITTDQQSGEIQQFKDKENKWYNYIKGKAVAGTDIDTKELNIQGVGKLSALSGNGQSLFDLNITVTGLAAQNMTLTGVSGEGTWTLSGNTVTRTGVSQIADTDPVVLTFTSNDGFDNPASQTVTSLPSEFNGQPTYNATNNTLSITFNSATLSANKNITIALANPAPEKTFGIEGKFDDTVENVVKDRYYKITVSYDSGSISPLSNFPGGDDILVTFYGGNVGDIPNLTNLPFDFDQNTADTKPGTNLQNIDPIGFGEVKLNQTAQNSATKIFIDDIDKNHNSIQDAFTRHGTPVAAVNVRLTRAADATKFIDYTISNFEEATTAVSSSNNNAFSGSATVGNTASGLISKVFQASEGHIFTTPPRVVFSDVAREENYNVVVQDASNTNNELTTRRFTISYDINDKENITTDKINFTAIASNNQTSTNKLYSVTCDQTQLNFYGGERDITVFGDPNSTFKISISDGSNTYDFSSNTFTSGSTESGTLTVTSDGSLATTIDFPAVTANKTYTATITALGSSAFNTSPATRQFTIEQKKEVFIRFTPTNANAIDTAAGETVTPSSVTVTSTGSSSAQQRVLLSYTITTSNDMVLLSTPQFNSWSGIGSSVNNTTREITLSNGGKVTIDNHNINIDNTVTPNQAVYTASAFISQFGTDDDTVTLNISNHLNAQSSSNQFVNLGVTENDTDLSSVALLTGHQILSSSTNASGTGKVVGDFTGQNIYDIVINVVSITDSSQITAFGLNSSSTSPQTTTPTSLTQISSNVWEATFNWSATLNAGNTAANNTYNVELSVDLNGIT